MTAPSIRVLMNGHRRSDGGVPMRREIRWGGCRVAAAAILGVMFGCGTAEPADAPATPEAQSTDIDAGADVDHVSAASDAVEALTAIEAALVGRDLDALVTRSVGPAAAFFGWMRHQREAAAATSDPFENLVIEPPVPEISVEDDVARVDATIGYGSQEGAPPRILTSLELHLVDGSWYLAGFDRNDIPIADWVTPAPAEATVTAGGIDVEVTGLFVDVGCFDGSDENCPGNLKDSVGVSFVVVNNTGGDISPVPVDVDGDTLAVLDAGGNEWPLVDAQVQGFPRDAPSPVVGVFQGASNLGTGGAVRLAWETTDGTVHAFELPVPTYPHDWAADGR
jgi:hypothetical protein